MRSSQAHSKNNGTVGRGGPQSVGRIFAILDSLAGRHEGASLAELAVGTGAPKTSLVGLLSGLVEEGCLRRDEAGRYSLGPRFLSLAMRAVAGRELITLARPVLAELAEATGETAVLGAMATDADLATYLDKAESSNPIRYAVTVGERRELYCTAMGKVLLAHFDDERFERYLKQTKRQAFTAATITAAADLRAERKRIRRDGFARTDDERGTGAGAFAAPIHDSDGAVIAAIIVAGPSPRVRENAERNERLVRQAAAECTRLVGGKPPASETTGTEQT